MRRIAFVFTGGTISMRVDAATGRAVPALSGEEVLACVPQVRRHVEPLVTDFARLPGPHMTLERMLALRVLLDELLAQPDVSGAVVTHGTDTLEETACLLDLQLRTDKPVVLTGALRNSSEPGWDGPANLLGAARTATDPHAAHRGALVVLNDTIHAAARVRKSHTHALDAFRSEPGPLGRVDLDRIGWQGEPARAERFPLVERLSARVPLLMAAAGDDGTLLDAAREGGTDGIVIAGTGRGNVPVTMVPAIQRALDAALPVVLASRCARGRVLDCYGYEGSASDLRRRGALLAGEHGAPQARIRLVLALSATREPAAIRALVEGGLYNEG